MQLKLPFGLLATNLFLFTAPAFGDDCLKTRAAFDIGSGTTKLKVAEVDTCLQKITKVLLEHDLPVAYKASLTDSQNGNFSGPIMKSGIQAILKLKGQANGFKPQKYYAVATSAFRKAGNSNQFVAKIKKRTGINVRIISQETEAKLGFAAASKLADGGLEKIVVWDIGGGSMQITTLSPTNKFTIYKGPLASVSFKEIIIQKLQGKSLSNVKTPNPMGQTDALKATDIARREATKTVPKTLQNKIKSGAQVIGIGGVHYYSIRSQVKAENHTYSMGQVQGALKARTGLTDTEIGGDYAATEISNLALVAGFMDALGIDSVKVGKINLADGLLVAPNYAL